VRKDLFQTSKKLILFRTRYTIHCFLSLKHIENLEVNEPFTSERVT
jgi:hypothetical protein